ncbi:MAG: DUF4383 domain-containing protein [Actinobacteria bacterium]|nr:DUF4383 domain-containing protein [Actinomycetota bacterium]
MFALVIGVVYLLVGIAGFFVAGSFTGGSADDKLILFPINHLHNIIHVALGVGWIWGSRTVATAKQINTLFGIVLLAVAVLGFVVPDFMQDLINVQSAGDADNFLHLVTGALGLYFGTAGAGDRIRTGTTS